MQSLEIAVGLDGSTASESALNMAIARVEQGLPADLGAQEATAPGSKVK